MAKRNHILRFRGYWQNHNVQQLTNASGVFCVYTCEKRAAPNSITPDKLIFIGESADVGNEIYFHPNKENWKSAAKKGQRLCFSFAEIDNDREQIAAALISKHKPQFNDETQALYLFDDMWIGTEGKNACLRSSFSIKGQEQVN